MLAASALLISPLVISILLGATRPTVAQVLPPPGAAAPVFGQEFIARRIMPLLETAEQRTIAGHMTSPIDGSAATLLLELAVLMPNSSQDGRLAVSAFLTRLSQDAAQAAASGDHEQELNLTILKRMIASSLDLPGPTPNRDPGIAPAPALAASADAGAAAISLQPPEAVADLIGPRPLPPPFAPGDPLGAPEDIPAPEPPALEAALPQSGQDPRVPVPEPTMPPAALGAAVLEAEAHPVQSGPADGPARRGIGAIPEGAVAQAYAARPDQVLADLRGPEETVPPAPSVAPSLPTAVASAPRGERGNDATAVASLPREVRPAPPAPSRDAARAAVPGEAELPRPMVAVLMKRGEEMVALGDISAARRLFERAAQAGDAAAALAAGKMYDPDILAGIHVRGIQPDPEVAQRWYRKAAALGGAAPAARPQGGATALAGNDDGTGAGGTGSPGMDSRRGMGVPRWRRD